MRVVFLFLSSILLHSCLIKDPIERPGYGPGYDNRKVLGWKAVYGADTTYRKVSFLPTPQAMINPGKIYVFGNTIFQNDVARGIHIIDNSNPSNARRVSFLEIPGNTEMAVKGNSMYVNNYNDIVVIDIRNTASPVEIKRLRDMFSTYNASRPYIWQAPAESGYYECPRFNNDSVIVRWVRDTVYAVCYRP